MINEYSSSVIPLVNVLLKNQITPKYKDLNALFKFLMSNKEAAGYLFGMNKELLDDPHICNLNDPERKLEIIKTIYKGIFGNRKGSKLFLVSNHFLENIDFYRGRLQGELDWIENVKYNKAPRGMATILQKKESIHSNTEMNAFNDLELKTEGLQKKQKQTFSNFNSKTNTICIEKDSDFLSGFGIFIVNDLRERAFEDKPSKNFFNDWGILEKWLDCCNREVSKDDEVKIGKAWVAYHAIGLAPSFKLQESFNSFSKPYKTIGYSPTNDKAPAEVMDVFDRLLASKEEIEKKREYDGYIEMEQFKKILGKTEKRNDKNKLILLSKKTKIYIVSFISWFIWAVFRTFNDYELLGIYLEAWDEDMFFVNVFLPFLMIWVAFKAFKWITETKT